MQRNAIDFTSILSCSIYVNEANLVSVWLLEKAQEAGCGLEIFVLNARKRFICALKRLVVLSTPFTRLNSTFMILRRWLFKLHSDARFFAWYWEAFQWKNASKFVYRSIFLLRDLGDACALSTCIYELSKCMSDFGRYFVYNFIGDLIFSRFTSKTANSTRIYEYVVYSTMLFGLNR